MLPHTPTLRTLDIPAPPDPASGKSEGTHQIAYTEWGDPHNPHIVFCVHGLTRNSRDFDYVAKALEQHYRVVCIDVVGRGRSSWLENKQHYTYPTYVADAIAVLNKLEIASVDWLGTSMGGLMGMMVAAYYPERINRMIINDIGPFIPKATLERIGKYVSITPIFPQREAAENHLRTILAPFGIKEAEHWRHIVIHSTEKQQNGTWRLAYDPAIAEIFKNSKEEAMQDVDLWPVWEKIICDVLVLRGAESDALLPETARKMQLTGPRARLVEFPAVGHAPALMEETQIKVVADWLGVK